MKKIAFNILALGVLAAAFTSCNDAEYDVIDNRVYIAEAVSTPIADVTMADPGTLMTSPVTIRLARAANADVKVKVDYSQSNLDAYNKRNQTSYEMVPAEYVSFPSEVVIPAGEISVTLPVEITAFKGEGGVDYALSLAITESVGMEMTNSSNTFIYALAAPLKQMVPTFKYDNASRIAPLDPAEWTYELNNYTLEWWSRVTNDSGDDKGYSINNQAIFSNSGSPELYIRFGDLVYSSGGRYKNNFLQVKTMGGQFDSGDPTKGEGLVSGEWYHFAVSYDAASGTSTLYKNGAKYAELTTAAGVPMNIKAPTMFASGRQYFQDNVQMCQLRLWKVTRTPDQISNFMRKEVKYTDPNLVFYIPMNDGEGATELRDVTGNGHNLVIGAGRDDITPKTEAYAWTEYDFSK